MSKRTVEYKETIEKVEKYLSDIGFDYEVFFKNFEDLDLFWTSEINIKNRQFKTRLGGKGSTKEESLCSLYGEVIERVSRINQENKDVYDIYDLINNKKYLITKKFGNFDITNNKWTAAGNSYYEAILHVFSRSEVRIPPTAI